MGLTEGRWFCQENVMLSENVVLPWAKRNLEAEAGVYQSSKAKNLRQRRKPKSGSGRLPIKLSQKSSPAQEAKKRKRASTDHKKSIIFAIHRIQEE